MYAERPLFAVRASARGDISLAGNQTSSENVAWSIKRDGPFLSTPLIYGDHLYCLSHLGILSCLDATTGKTLYRQRLGGGVGYAASPVAADGKIYLTCEDGSIKVVKAGSTFELLAVNEMGDACLATPAISDGMLFVRTQKQLYGIGRRLEP
jgi:outer membrane protein assembly factor BamB